MGRRGKFIYLFIVHEFVWHTLTLLERLKWESKSGKQRKKKELGSVP